VELLLVGHGRDFATTCCEALPLPVGCDDCGKTQS
jgi:hypothetical protein